MKGCSIVLVSVLALGSCTSKLRNDELERVAKDWSYVIRASQVIPVYPPTEDLQPGDVLLVSTPIDQQVEVYKEKGFLPLDQMFVRLHSGEFADLWEGVFEDFYNARYGTGGDLAPPAQWQRDGWDKAPRAAFPTYKFSVKSGAGFNLAIPISGVPFGLGLMNSGEASGAVTLSDVSTFGLDNYRLHRIVSQWTRANRLLLRNYEPRRDDRHFLRVVTRVYVVGSVDVSIHNDEATAAGAEAGAAGPLELLGVDPDDPEATYAGAMAEINELATNIAPGGALKFASASSRAVSLKETFPRPLVIGYVGFDLPILRGGRIGAPISTLSQLTDQKTIPAATGRDSVYRLATLNHLYRALNAVEQDATAAEREDVKRVRAALDGLAQHLPSTYSFTLIELNEDHSIMRNDEPELPIAGNDVPREVFTDVTDYLSSARTTIESLERHLAKNAPAAADEASLRAELETARVAYDRSAPILQGNASVLDAIDFVFLGS